MKLALAGGGAFGHKHLDGLRLIDDVEVIALVGRRIEPTQSMARAYGIHHATTELADVLAMEKVDGVILCTPTHLHAHQAMQCLQAGKHVQIEIPLADSLEDADAVAKQAAETGLIAMCGHTRRFNPSHQYIRRRIAAGVLSLQHLQAQTYFFRRSNINAKGEPRSWTDHLLWHHAAHTVDLFQYQTGERVIAANALEGPHDPELGIAMDMTIQLKTHSGALCSLSLSFNNNGPLGTSFRYICDNGTYLARYDDLERGDETPVDLSGTAVSMNGIELQDREFVSAIREGRQPEASVADVLPCYEVLHRLDQQLRAQRC
ncbi:MAG: Gfo/Idh/MocA family oxidoreductase [Pseudomonadota bacterium]